MENYKPRILTVEDHPTMRKLIRSILEKQYTILEAAGGKEALQILHDEDPPDLILLDIMMPDMDGYQVFSEIRKNPRIASIPIIFVTALGGKVAELKGLDLGAVDYISKPFDKTVLEARIESALELHRFFRQQTDPMPELASEFFQPDDNIDQQPDNAEPNSDKRPVILSVDDDKMARRLIEEGLANNYEVISCCDAADVFAYLDYHPKLDLILLDIMLPDQDGFEIIDRLKTSTSTASIPVIFITARKETEDEIRGFQSGAVDYVRKPIDLPILKARIQNQLMLERKKRFFEAQMERFKDE